MHFQRRKYEQNLESVTEVIDLMVTDGFTLFTYIVSILSILLPILAIAVITLLLAAIFKIKKSTAAIEKKLEEIYQFMRENREND